MSVRGSSLSDGVGGFGRVWVGGCSVTAVWLISLKATDFWCIPHWLGGSADFFIYFLFFCINDHSSWVDAEKVTENYKPLTHLLSQIWSECIECVHNSGAKRCDLPYVKNDTFLVYSAPVGQINLLINTPVVITHQCFSLFLYFPPNIILLLSLCFAIYLLRLSLLTTLKSVPLPHPASPPSLSFTLQLHT